MKKLTPYNKYQPVEYDYISEVPEGWQLLPNIAVFEERIERGFVDEELLSVTIGRGVIRQTDVDIKKDSSNEDKSKYKLIKVGDIAYNRMRMWQGALGYSDYRGITSPAYVILKPKMKINQRFFHYMFRARFYTNYSKRFSYGIVDDQLSLRYVDFKRMYSIIPPLDSQNDIVAYLDLKTKKTREFIQKKENLIELLEEEKKTFISNAVKNDGITTPKDWRLTKLKYVITKLGDGLHSTPEYVDSSDYYFINGNNLVDGDIVITDSTRCISEPVFKKHKKELSDRTVLYSINGTIGNIAFYNEEKVALGKSAAYINCGKHLSPKFLFYVLQSKIVKDFYGQEVTGTTIFNLGLQSLKNTPIAISSLEEQNTVVLFIETGLKKLDEAISKAKLEIEKAKEYKESLITQLVTGQLKVPTLTAEKVLN
ncbi:MAG: restriction endonuclease subunit S [Cyclobacteriaceae bacterium]